MPLQSFHTLIVRDKAFVHTKNFHKIQTFV